MFLLFHALFYVPYSSVSILPLGQTRYKYYRLHSRHIWQLLFPGNIIQENSQDLIFRTYTVQWPDLYQRWIIHPEDTARLIIRIRLCIHAGKQSGHPSRRAICVVRLINPGQSYPKPSVQSRTHAEPLVVIALGTRMRPGLIR